MLLEFTTLKRPLKLTWLIAQSHCKQDPQVPFVQECMGHKIQEQHLMIINFNLICLMPAYQIPPWEQKLTS